MSWRGGWLAVILILCCATERGIFAQKVAITIDDLPETDDLVPGTSRLSVIKAIVQALQDAKAPKVYGFVNAQTLVDEPWLIHVLEAWRTAGFMLGNHTYTHFDSNAQSTAAYVRDIRLDEPVLERLMTGEDWHWFRYPYLHEGGTPQKRAAVRQYLRIHGYRIAQVTIDFHDYAWDQPYVRCATRHDVRSLAELKSMYLVSAAEAIQVAEMRSQALYGRNINYVMLLHDGAIEAVMLPELLSLLKKSGFSLVTLEQAESDAAYSDDPGIVSKEGGTLLEQMMILRGLHDTTLVTTPDKKLESMCRTSHTR